MHFDKLTFTLFLLLSFIQFSRLNQNCPNLCPSPSQLKDKKLKFQFSKETLHWAVLIERWKEIEDTQATQRGSYKEHTSPRFFVSADSHSLRWAVSPLNQLNCSLIWAILKPRGAVVVVHGGTHGGLPLVRVTRY